MRHLGYIKGGKKVNMREIASLACRILGIFFIIQGTNVLSLTLSVAATSPIVHESSFNVIFSLIYILFGLLLWFLSDKLSAILIKRESYSNQGSGLGASDIQRVCFSVLGLYFFGNSVPKLVSALTNMYSMTEIFTTRILLGSIGVITEFIIGLGIFLGSQGLVNFLNTVRTAGRKRGNDSEDKE
jgi:hypothetical protein